MSGKRGPKPWVTYNDRTYTCKAWSVEIPDLDAMDGMAALVWLNQNTIPTGYSRNPNPLAGFGDILEVTVR